MHRYRAAFSRAGPRDRAPRSGITFDEAIADGEALDIEGRKVPIIGFAALVKNKRAAGREQDLADIAALTAAARRNE